MRRFVSKVTEKTDKLSKEELQRLIHNLSHELELEHNDNEEYEAIIESVTSGLLVVDENYVYVHSNSTAQRMLGISLGDVFTSDEKPVWNLIAELEIADFLENCSDKKVTNATEDFSVTTDGGSVRFLTVSVNPLFQESLLKGYVVRIDDVTEKKNQDVLLHRMENLASLTNLAAGMAHEIKNPLGAISIHIQLVQKALEKARQNDDVLPAKKFVEDHIDVVNEEIQHLNSLVMDFLFAVRPVNAKLELKNPVSIIQTVADFFKPEFQKSGITFETELSEKESKILIDEKLFREVLMNMAQNSLAAIKQKFPDGNVENLTGRFRIGTGTKDGKYIVVITDNGCGMSEETVAKLFEPYYTTKANGTGLGMTMCYKIVKEFSGEIRVDSVEGEGSNFVLSFPLPQSETKLLS
ncbi:MAG: ATP-binding protein [Treponema sp.]|nr:ATP-binding protein [Treponema sp.]